MYLSAFVFLILFLFVGCSTNPVAYSFIPADDYSSSLAFKTGNPSVSFVSYNGRTLPKAANNTHWDPISFPSGTELRLIVHADYRTNTKTTLRGFGLLGAVVNIAQDINAISRNVDADLEIICPPLDANKKYQLYFTKEPGIPGRNILTVIEIDTNKVVYQYEFKVGVGGDTVLSGETVFPVDTALQEDTALQGDTAPPMEE
jgi:hypothetical protein